MVARNWGHTLGTDGPRLYVSSRCVFEMIPTRFLYTHSFNFFPFTAPASSCDVERAFSKGGLTISKYRHALTDDSTRASVLLDSWSQIPNLISEAEIIKIFKDKSRRVGKAGLEESESTESAASNGGGGDLSDIEMVD